jgi:CubicO group peptidase (beta-lactamase class C family)
MQKSILLILSIVLILSCKENFGKLSSTPSLAEDKTETFEWLDQKIDSTMKVNNVPALSVGIIRNDELVYAKGFGFLTRESKVQVNENTLYQIGSDTKKFTGIIVNNLVAQGKLNLEEPITTYLKKDLSNESIKKLATITVRTLLHHKSGIPNREPSNRRIDGDPMLVEFSEEDLVKDLNILELDFQPNSKFSYSNFGYAIVGYICEKVSGQDYSILVKTYITDKYDMPNTVVYPNKKQSQQIALPYRKDDRIVPSKPWTMGKMTPAGGIYSNVKDISNLMLAQMKAYQKFHRTREKSDPLILTENPDGNEGEYGFGLGKNVDEYGVRYGHGGDLDGYGSEYVFSPEYNLGIILLTSSGGGWIGNLNGTIRKEMIDKIRG